MGKNQQSSGWEADKRNALPPGQCSTPHCQWLPSKPAGFNPSNHSSNYLIWHPEITASFSWWRQSSVLSHFTVMITSVLLWILFWRSKMLTSMKKIIDLAALWVLDKVYKCRRGPHWNINVLGFPKFILSMLGHELNNDPLYMLCTLSWFSFCFLFLYF